MLTVHTQNARAIGPGTVVGSIPATHDPTMPDSALAG
jgi:hypothetical protein